MRPFLHESHYTVSDDFAAALAAVIVTICRGCVWNSECKHVQQLYGMCIEPACNVRDTVSIHGSCRSIIYSEFVASDVQCRKSHPKFFKYAICRAWYEYTGYEWGYFRALNMLHVSLHSVDKDMDG